jgi:hypothetical protein
MQAERKKILEMLAEGKISAEDAEKLLDKIGSNPAVNTAPSAKNPDTKTLPEAAGRKFLRILISSATGREEVNMRVPLALMRGGIKLLTVLPPRVAQKLAAKGFDLSGLLDSGGELTKSIEELDLDVDSGEGQKLRVYCE